MQGRPFAERKELVGQSINARILRATRLGIAATAHALANAR
jgi:hypothetical protein